MSLQTLPQRIALDISARADQVQSAIQLLDEGATVPFIARYRKEVTGGLDDAQLRLLEERLTYLRELEARRETILKSIADQDKLTDELEKAILAAETKTLLEDIYLPYKPKRRTKAQIAREAGLEPLALDLLEDPTQDPDTTAATYINEEAGVADAVAALDGARQILLELMAENAALVGELREYLWDNGIVTSTVAKDKEQEGAKFKDYFDYQERLAKIPSHRALALFRGRNEGVLYVRLQLPHELEEGRRFSEWGPCEPRIAKAVDISNQGRAADAWLADTVGQAWRYKLSVKLEVDLFMRLREAAETEAIKVFGMNLKDLLLAAPAGAKTTIGLDPGLRTGVKVAVTDATGKVVDTATIYPHAPKNQWDQAIAVVAALAQKHNASLLSIGNGTASRETEKMAAELIKMYPALGLQKLVVSEAGASVYSASAYASQELPDMDVSIRGAVSIARRLQDPLAELVKIEPKAIGVGQYQHDVNQVQLARTLDAIVEDCVNSVGVDLNLASAPLLAKVSGLSATLASNVVEYRDTNGAFTSRKALKKVPRLGEKTFEQAAGFLKIQNADNPLDGSAVHPESYSLVLKMAEKANVSVAELIGNRPVLRSLKPSDFVDDQYGLPTVQDVLEELEKPGRDPRPEFKTATFKDGVEKLSDLVEGMQLQGVVTNVTNFGAFVDVGVHQDGLVHISQLADKFVSDPREIVKTGDVVSVTVTEVDVPRKRIALSMKSDAMAERGSKPAGKAKGSSQQGKQSQSNTRQQAKKGGNKNSGNSGMGSLGDIFDKL